MTNARKLANRAIDTVSVKDFGAVGDGVTDDTAAIQAAITASKSIYFPAGNYKTTASLSCSSANSLIGAGRSSVTLSPVGNFNVLAFTSSATGGMIENLTIDGTLVTGGNLISITDQSRFIVNNVTLVNGYNGIYVQDQNVCTISNVWINGLSGAYAVKNYGSTSTAANVFDLNNIQIGFSTNIASSPVGIIIDSGVNTVDIRHVAVQKGFRGLQITNTLNITNKPAFVTAHDFQSENTYDSGLYIDPGSGNTNTHMFSNLYSCGSVAGSGVYIGDGSGASAGVNNVQIIGGQIGNNYKQGVYIAGSYVTVQGCAIFNNSLSGSAAYPGIQVVGRSASNNRGCLIIGNLSGQRVGYSTQLTSYGVQIDAYCTAYAVTGNNLRLNVTAAYLDTPADGTSVISDNITAATTGGRIPGSLRVASGVDIPAGGATTVGLTASTTANLGIFFGSAAPTMSAAQGSLYVRTDGSSTSTRLYVNANGSTTWTNVVTAA